MTRDSCGYYSLTVREFRSHVSQWETALRRVQGFSEAEKGTKFRSSLPKSLCNRLREEYARETRGRYWVKILKPSPISIEEIREWVAAMLTKKVRVKEYSTFFAFEVSEFEEQEILMACSGTVVRGNPLNILTFIPDMDYREMKRW